MSSPTDPSPRGGWRENLYSRLRVSVKTMDIIIAVVAVLLVAALIVGVITGGKR